MDDNREREIERWKKENQYFFCCRLSVWMGKKRCEEVRSRKRVMEVSDDDTAVRPFVCGGCERMEQEEKNREEEVSRIGWRIREVVDRGEHGIRKRIIVESGVKEYRFREWLGGRGALRSEDAEKLKRWLRERRERTGIAR